MFRLSLQWLRTRCTRGMNDVFCLCLEILFESGDRREREARATKVLPSISLIRGWLTRKTSRSFVPSFVLRAQPAPLSTAGAGSPTSQRQDPVLDEVAVLRVINEYRCQFGAPPLRWSRTCAREAQKRASHRSVSTAEFGENLARSTSLAWHDPTAACVGSLHRWQVIPRL